MLGALAEAALSRPRAMLGGAALVLVVLALLAAGAPSRLGVAPTEAAGSPSAEVADDVSAMLGREGEPELLIAIRGRDPVDSAVYQVALDVLSSQAKSDPEVAAVRRGPVSEDELTTVLEVYFRDDDPAAQQQAVDRISEALDPGPLTAQVGGEATALLDARRSAAAELVGLELLAVPLTVLVIALVAGLRLIAAPLACAGLAIAGSAAGLRLLAGPLELSVVGLLPAAITGLVLGVESSLLLVRRHRDELEIHRDSEEAVRRAVREAGRPIVATAVAGAIVPLALLVVPLAGARSAAIGVALAAALAGLAALTVTPSLLVLYGPDAEEPQTDVERSRGIVPRFIGLIGERRLIALLAALISVAALLAAARPALDTEALALASSGLPSDADSRRAEDRLAADIGIEATSRATVALPAGDRRRAGELRMSLEKAPGVARASRPEGVGELDTIAVGLEARRGTLVARDAIRGLRTAAAPFGARVGGYDAAALDADDELAERLPVAAGIAALALALVVFALGRRPFLALGLGVASLLPAAAAAGLLGLVFGEGRLPDALDYVPAGGAQLDAGVAVIAALVGVSAARSAAYPILLSGERVVAVRQRAAERVARLGLPAAAAASAIGAAAAAVLVGSDVLGVKQAGLAIAAGLVLDLVALRVVLVPALGRLLQRARP